MRRLFDAAVAAADPLALLPEKLPPPPRSGRTVVIGAGKAAARMALAVERAWTGPVEGLVITRYGHGEPCACIEVVEAAHPLPDAAGLRASARMLALVESLGRDDLVVCLLSGGGSALLELPPPGISLADAQGLGRALLRSGATIAEMNCVRKHLSLVKGGRLAVAAHPARVVTYAISDVPGDDPSVIASGPTVPDATTYAEAAAILARYGIEEPAAAVGYVRTAASRAEGECDETPKPGDAAFARDEIVVLATAGDALAAAADAARTAGVAPIVLGDNLQGEARELGAAHAALARAGATGMAAEGAAARPCVILSGGETTVTVSGAGRGGRHTEYLLGLALALRGEPGIYALAADTDGIDGTEDNAGALVAPETLARARAAGVDPAAALAANDAYGVFAAAGSLLITGPTRTNVNDFRAILVQPCRLPAGGVGSGGSV